MDNPYTMLHWQVTHEISALEEKLRKLRAQEKELEELREQYREQNNVSGTDHNMRY